MYEQQRHDLEHAFLAKTSLIHQPLQRGDRVRIKEGYDDSGRVGFYEAKANDEAGKVVVFIEDVPNILLADAIEPFPYNREERILRAIEDFHYSFDIDYDSITDVSAVLYAILDAGV